MLNWEERRQLVRVAKLYYDEGWTQQQIAKKVGVSRPVITKMLQKSKAEGIVEVYINVDNIQTVELEKRLAMHFSLKEVVIVPTGEYTLDSTRKTVGQAAAHYIAKKLDPLIKRLGISWGTTMAEVVKEYPYERRENIKIVPLVGGMGIKNVEIHSNQLAYELAKKMNGTCTYLYAPAIVDTLELKNRLMGMEDISQVLEEAKHIEAALVGIGNPYQVSTMKEIGYLQEDDIQELKNAGAVGDIGSRFFDSEGVPIQHELNKYVIGLPLEELKKVPYVIGIVEGIYKADSVKAALKGGYLDCLIIDEETARALLH